MNRNALLLPAFVAMLAVQLAVPAWMIVRRELTLAYGTRFKFRTEPVDPADYFRGRYVQLRLEPDTASVATTDRWEDGMPAYVSVSAGSNGYAEVTGVRKTPPPKGDYVRVRIGWRHEGASVNFAWPMDRFYMEEGKAPAAEQAYREHSSRTNRACHVTVRIRHGNAVIEDLFIDGKPIRAYLKSQK